MPTNPEPSRLHGLIRTFWIPFVLLFLACTAWTFATPMAGVPDEPAHIIRAAGAAQGQFYPDGTDEVGRGYFEVPASLADARAWEDCFAHKPLQDASCQVIAGAASGQVRVSTTASLYNPAYYVAVGWPALLTEDPYVMVYSMRLLTGVVTAALAAIAFHFLSTMMGVRRSGLVLAMTVTPMVLFLGGAVNPNAWEIVGGMAILAAVLSLGYRRDRPASPVAALMVIGVVGALVCNLRGISPLWVAVLGVIGLIALPWQVVRDLLRKPAAWVAAGIILAGVALAVLWGVSAGAFTLEGDFANKNWTAGQVLESMVRRTVFEVGYVGLFGWTDTSAPLIAVVTIGGLAVLTIAAAFWLGSRRFLIVTVLAGAAWLLLPALVQLSYVRSAGMIWQARYSMAMYVGVVVIAAVATHLGWGSRPVPRSARLTWVLGALVWAAHVYTFVIMQTRYARGTGGTIWMLFKEPLWSPPLGAPFWLALLALSVGAFVVFLARTHDRVPDVDRVDDRDDRTTLTPSQHRSEEISR